MTENQNVPQREDRQEYGAPDMERASWAATFFLFHPTFGLLLVVLLILGGLLAYLFLVKESLPDLEIPQATVTTQWAGADPQTMEQEVTEKIEKEIKSLKGLKRIESASFDSYSIIVVEFDANADLQASMQRLRSRVSDAEAELPKVAEKPRIEQVSVDDRPILSFVLYGDVGDALLSQLADALKDRLERVAGVNEVTLGGKRDEVVQVQLFPERLLALGISPTEVRDAIQRANVDMPWGEIESEKIGATVRLYGRFRSVEELREVPVTRLGGVESGRVVRLRELADVRRDLEEDKTRGFFSRKGSAFESAIEVSVKKLPGADAVSVIDAVKFALEDVQSSTDWPGGLEYQVTQDESEKIWTSLGDVFNNAWQAMLAVFAILFIMLTWREGLIAGLSIPLTFLGALVCVWALGYSLNELVIIGMVLALGLLVDVFILMMEGMHEGIFVDHLSFEQAALRTVQRYALPAFAGQLTTILALAPLMAIGGVAGKFIRVLPVTAIVCLGVAFGIALLVDLPLSRFLLGRFDPKKAARTTRADRLTAAAGERLSQWSLRFWLRSRPTAALWVGGAVVIFLLSLVGFSQVPVVMYPKNDGRKLGITVELPPSTRLDTSQTVADRLGEVLRQEDAIESVVKLVGKKSPMAQSSLGDALSPTTAKHFVGFSCMLVPREERDLPGYRYADQLRQKLRAALNEFAGATLVLVPETGQPSAEAPVQINLTGPGMDELRAISNAVQAALRAVPGTVDVRDNLGSVRAEVKLIPRREAIDFYGLSQQDLATQVRFQMSNDEVGKFAVGGVKDDLSIRLGLAWPSRAGRVGGPTRVEELAMVRAFTPSGESVSLMPLLESRVSTAPVSITHKDGLRSIQVMAKTEEDVTPTEITAVVTPVLERMQETWLPNYRFAFGGEVEETAETFASAGAMLMVAVVLVFGVLVLMFGSFTQSLILILTMPLALIGTFLGFFLVGTPFSFFAMVGTISLIGIVVNDAIVMVDTMNGHLRRGTDVAVAAARGAAERLRPILSTSLTTIIGLIPLAVSNPMWRPLCYAVIFGLVASTVTSLVIVPCLYRLFTGKEIAAANSNKPLDPVGAGGHRP